MGYGRRPSFSGHSGGEKEDGPYAEEVADDGGPQGVGAAFYGVEAIGGNSVYKLGYRGVCKTFVLKEGEQGACGDRVGAAAQTGFHLPVCGSVGGLSALACDYRAVKKQTPEFLRGKPGGGRGSGLEVEIYRLVKKRYCPGERQGACVELHILLGDARIEAQLIVHKEGAAVKVVAHGRQLESVAQGICAGHGHVRRKRLYDSSSEVPAVQVAYLHLRIQYVAVQLESLVDKCGDMRTYDIIVRVHEPHIFSLCLLQPVVAGDALALV